MTAVFMELFQKRRNEKERRVVEWPARWTLMVLCCLVVVSKMRKEGTYARPADREPEVQTDFEALCLGDDAKVWVTRDRDLWGKCVARDFTVDHPQCPTNLFSKRRDMTYIKGKNSKYILLF